MKMVFISELVGKTIISSLLRRQTVSLIATIIRASVAELVLNDSPNLFIRKQVPIRDMGCAWNSEFNLSYPVSLLRGYLLEIEVCSSEYPVSLLRGSLLTEKILIGKRSSQCFMTMTMDTPGETLIQGFALLNLFS